MTKKGADRVISLPLVLRHCKDAKFRPVFRLQLLCIWDTPIIFQNSQLNIRNSQMYFKNLNSENLNCNSENVNGLVSCLLMFIYWNTIDIF